MSFFTNIFIVAVALALLIGSAPVTLTGNALAAGETWDRFGQCKIRCNEAYGGLDIFPPNLRGGSQAGWNDCILQCERKHWRDVERETRD